MAKNKRPFRLARALNNSGAVLVQGDEVAIQVSTKDPYVNLVEGETLLLADFTGNDSQWTPIANLKENRIATPPRAEVFGAPSADPQPSVSLADLQNQIRRLFQGGNSFEFAWAKTLKYDIGYYNRALVSGALPDPTKAGTAYATIVNRPENFVELLPFSMHPHILNLPANVRRNSFVSFVADGPFAQISPAITGKKGDVRTFSYSDFQASAHKDDDPTLGIWRDGLAESYGLSGMLPPGAQYSATLVGIIIGDLGALPAVPFNILIGAVLQEIEAREVDEFLNASFNEYLPPPPRIVFAGATPQDTTGIGFVTGYQDASSIIKDEL